MTHPSVSSLLNLDGRVAAITGGAGHIGLQAARALGELGSKIILLDHDEIRLERGVSQIEGECKTAVVAERIDLRQLDSLHLAMNRVLGHFGRLDILVHCAALVGDSKLSGWSCAFEEQSLDSWREALDVNLSAPFALNQAAVPALRRSGAGSIIHIASIYGIVGPDLSLYQATKLGQPAAYAASKGGLIQHARWLSTVLAPEIRVNVISPGGIARDQPPQFRERYCARTPMRRMGTETDVAGAIVFLATDLSSYVTGTNLVVDGGWTAW